MFECNILVAFHYFYDNTCAILFSLLKKFSRMPTKLGILTPEPTNIINTMCPNRMVSSSQLSERAGLKLYQCGDSYSAQRLLR